MAVTNISPARQDAPSTDGTAPAARGVADCTHAIARAVAESSLAAAELAQDAAELVARAREARLEQQRRRAAITGVAIDVAAIMRDGRRTGD